MSDPDPATNLWQQALARLTAGDLAEAMDLFNQSIALKPTAEGHTFRGWAFSFLDRLDDAIRDCEQAILLDPDFGNPYNDIGVYLMRKDRLDEAIPWLERAKLAKRYEPRHFPFSNLGIIFERQGRWQDALHEYQAALLLDSRHEPAMSGLVRLRLQIQ